MKEKKVILIMGQRGSGKSYLAKHLVKDCKRLLIYDTLGEYDYGVIIENLPEFKNFFLKVYDKNFRITYQPVNPVNDFDIICDIVFETGDITFLVEELDTFCNPQGISDSFANIIQRGRHRNITFIGITQRPFGIPRLITSQAKTIYSFIHREPRDVEYLKAFIGEEAERIKDLKQYEFLKWDGKISIEKLP